MGVFSEEHHNPLPAAGYDEYEILMRAKGVESNALVFEPTGLSAGRRSVVLN